MFCSMKSRHPELLRAVVVVVSATPPQFIVARHQRLGIHRTARTGRKIAVWFFNDMEAFHLNIRLNSFFGKLVKTM